MFPQSPLLDGCRLPHLSARSADDASSRRRRFAQYRFIPSLAACDDRRRPSSALAPVESPPRSLHPAVWIDLSVAMRIGVDLGGTKIEAVVMGEHTRLVVRDRMATPQSDAIQKRPKLLDTREP
jgi:hypothetical protein